MDENIIGEEVDLKYDDLDAEVEGEFGGYPIPDNEPMWAPITYADEYTAKGHINHWVYTHEITKEDVEGYIKYVLKQEPTEKLINRVTIDDIYDYLLNMYRDDAIEDAKERFDHDEVDYDEVNWEEPYDYDESDEEYDRYTDSLLDLED